MIIKNKNKIINTNDLVLTIDNERSEFVKEIKYLGMVINEELKFNAHLNYICKKSSARVGSLHRIKDKIGTETRICTIQVNNMSSVHTSIIV